MEWASHLEHHDSLADNSNLPVPLAWIESDKTRKSDGLRIIKYQQLRHGCVSLSDRSADAERSPIFDVYWAASSDSVSWYYSFRRKDAVAAAKGEEQKFGSGPRRLPQGKVIKL